MMNRAQFNAMRARVIGRYMQAGDVNNFMRARRVVRLFPSR